MMKNADLAPIRRSRRGDAAIAASRKDLQRALWSEGSSKSIARRAGQTPARGRLPAAGRIASRGVTGFEALMRWQHPARGVLAPDQFLAGRRGFGAVARARRGGAAHRTAQMRAWLDAGIEFGRVAVNLSAVAVPRRQSGPVRHGQLQRAQCAARLTSPRSRSPRSLCSRHRRDRRDSARACVASEFSSRSTISAPAIRAHPTPAAFRSTRSRSTAGKGL